MCALAAYCKPHTRIHMCEDNNVYSMRRHTHFVAISEAIKIIFYCIYLYIKFVIIARAHFLLWKS